MGEVLSYAPRTKWSVFRRHRRAIRAALLIALCGTTIAFVRKPIAREILWRHSFQKCMEFAMPTNNRKLPSFNGAYSWLVPGIEMDLGTDVAPWNPGPGAWFDLCLTDRRTDRVKHSLFITFLGRMQRPDGKERLVILAGRSTSAVDLQGISVLVLAPPGLFEFSPRRSWSPATVHHGPGIEAQLENAWCDTTDPTHILIPITVEAGYRRYVSTLMDGYLQNDDSMRIQLRDDLPGVGRKTYTLSDSPKP
jgi:hypothetical protein